MGGGLVESETLLRGKKTVTLVAGPFNRGFLRPNADAYNTIRVLLVPVEAVNIVLSGLDK